MGSSLLLKMEGALLILTLVVISIPIASLAVIFLLPLNQRRNSMVIGCRGRRSEVLELDMNAMIDARLRQTSVDPFIEMVDLTPECSGTKSDNTSKPAFKLLPPLSDQIQ